VEDVTKVTVYSNQPEVELFVNGESIGKKTAPDHFFYFEVNNVGESEIVAKAGELTDSGKIRKVEVFNEEYRLKEKGAILNWFDVDAPEGRFSLNDKLGDIMTTLRGKLWFVKLGLKLKIEDMKFDSILASVQSGGVDIGVAGLTVTDERKKSVDFSSSYATGVQSIIVTEGSTIATVDDLKDKKIGVQLSTTGDIYASGDYGDENVTKYNKGADAVMALLGGEVDAVIIDDQPAKVFVEENEGLKILDTEYITEEYAIAISKDNKALTEKINIALEELVADGTIDAIVAKYIKAE
jgi:polar amino acid transport system substrate-binding protein